MREIKFRVWDEANKKWIYKVVIDNNGNLWAVIGKNFYNIKILHPDDYNTVFFTGLKDKNGKEIYKGDYCKSKGCEGIIEFDSGCFSIKILKEQEYYDIGQSIYLCDYLAIFKDTEVVSNIYENPELIK